MTTPRYLQIFGLAEIPEIRPGDDLPTLILEACRRGQVMLQPSDILIVAQKIVSKAEGRLVDLNTIAPSAFAQALAENMSKDPRFIEVVLRESRRIVRGDARVLITETHHGFICANAGVDQSNVPQANSVSLLPVDPDASAARLRERIRAMAGIDTAVIVADTFGRPWREGLVNVALGVAGITPLRDFRGLADGHGRSLKATVIAVADELCSAAELVMGKDAHQPVAVVRGFVYEKSEGGSQSLLRPPHRDLFR
ncbi:MAG: coenzyme F420-0:L-glutamate ligase [Acidobacteria bacterium]|nr:coenzyme F420-0:L-glutamate ligase [Acidobacteriota bacterium]MBI3655938.1 coenzyme F420-0:L-glutamate ligase [Acidobacteriota bacterium]